MIKNTFVQANLKMEAFKANRIIFDDTDLVSVDVKCKMNDVWMNTTFLFTFRQFNDLLRFSGATGEKLQLLVSDKLIFAKEKPYIIQLENESFIFSSCRLELFYIIAGDITCFSVEDVTPIPYLQQVKNLRKNISDFADIQLSPQNTVKNTLQQLSDLYRYYSGLLDLNLSENAAREKSGLSNEYLFKLAYQAYCQK